MKLYVDRLWLCKAGCLSFANETSGGSRETGGPRSPKRFTKNIRPKLVMGFFQLPNFLINTTLHPSYFKQERPFFTLAPPSFERHRICQTGNVSLCGFNCYPTYSRDSEIQFEKCHTDVITQQQSINCLWLVAILLKPETIHIVQLIQIISM